MKTQKQKIMSYIVQEENFVVSAPATFCGVPEVYVIHDEPEFDTQTLQEGFNYECDLFIRRLQDLKVKNSPLTQKEKDELSSSLNVLLSLHTILAKRK